MGLEVADHPAAAVVVDEQRLRWPAARPGRRRAAPRSRPRGPGSSGLSTRAIGRGGPQTTDTPSRFSAPGLLDACAPRPARSRPPLRQLQQHRGCRARAPARRVAVAGRRRRCTRGGSPQAAATIRCSLAAGSRGGATRQAGYAILRDESHTGASPRIASLDGGTMEAATTTAPRPATGRPSDGCRPARLCRGRSRPRSGRARRAACSTPARTATATCSRSAIAYEGTWVMLADPEAIKQVFTGDPKVFHAGEGNEILAPLLGRNSLLVLDEKPPHEPAQAAAAALPRRAHAGLRADDERDRRARDRELADRHPLQAAAADAGDDPGDHPAHGLRRRRGRGG